MSFARDSDDGGATARRAVRGRLGRVLALGWIGLLVAYAALAIGSCVAAAIVWGPWLDEFYSLYVTDPARPLSELWGYWVTDNHPFYFSFFTRELRALLPLSLIGLRLANLVPLLAILAMAGLYGRRDREGRLFVLLSLVLLLSSGALFDHLHDFRSYFSLLAAGYANALATAYLFRKPPPQRLSILLWLLSAALLANIHYLGTLFAALQAGVLAVILAAQGRRCLGLGLAAATAAAALPSIGYAVYQSGFILSETGGRFWVRSTTGEAFAMIGSALPAQTGRNLAAYAACLLAVAGALGGVRARRLGPALRGGPVLPGLLAVVGAGIAFLAVLLLVNLHTPIFVERYLVPLNGPLCVGLALALSTLRPAVLRSAAAVLVLINAGLTLSLVRSEDYRLRAPRWNATAAYIAQQVAACPTTRILAIDSGNPRGPQLSPVFLTGYGYLAGRYGFAFTPLVATGRVTSRPSGPCPEIFWMEHLLGVRPDAQAATDWMRQIGVEFASDPRRTRTYWGETGGVILVAPAG
jgi:hypothetical protein